MCTHEMTEYDNDVRTVSVHKVGSLYLFCRFFLHSDLVREVHFRWLIEFGLLARSQQNYGTRVTPGSPHSRRD
jgi:hypothetical protein